jgi:hypothetical protein
MEDKFCVNCRHAVRGKPMYPISYECTYQQPRNLVTGEQYSVPCEELRSENCAAFGCGLEGHWWEPAK